MVVSISTAPCPSRRIISPASRLIPMSKCSQLIARSWNRTSRSTITADFSPRLFRSASVTFVGRSKGSLISQLPQMFQSRSGNAVRNPD